MPAVGEVTVRASVSTRSISPFTTLDPGDLGGAGADELSRFAVAEDDLEQPGLVDVVVVAVDDDHPPLVVVQARRSRLASMVPAVPAPRIRA